MHQKLNSCFFLFCKCVNTMFFNKLNDLYNEASIKSQTNKLIKSILTLKVNVSNLEEVFLLQLWFYSVKNHNSSSMRCWAALYLGSTLHLSEGFSKISTWRSISDREKFNQGIFSMQSYENLLITCMWV